MDDSMQDVDTPSSIEQLLETYTNEHDAPIMNAPSTTARSSKPRKPAGAKRKHGLGDSESIEGEAGAARTKRQRRATPASGGITFDNDIELAQEWLEKTSAAILVAASILKT